MTEPSSNKRKAAPGTKEPKSKRSKDWKTTHYASKSQYTGKDIHPGDSGIWVTCDRGRERKCADEILDFFVEYGKQMYPHVFIAPEDDAGDQDDDGDIEKAIAAELSAIKNAKPSQLFQVIRPDLECVLFVKTKPPIDPVAFVNSLCEDIAAGKISQRCRHALRLTPATSTEKAYEKNFEDLARRVIAPVFHGEDVKSKTFAIRFTSRNHQILKRDAIIKTTAEIVGDKHKVNLGQPELVILVEVFKTICTMAVVDGKFNDLKKYNIAELSNVPVEDKPEPNETLP